MGHLNEVDFLSLYCLLHFLTSLLHSDRLLHRQLLENELVTHFRTVSR